MKAYLKSWNSQDFQVCDYTDCLRARDFQALWPAGFPAYASVKELPQESESWLVRGSRSVVVHNFRESHGSRAERNSHSGSAGHLKHLPEIVSVITVLQHWAKMTQIK